MKKIIFYFLPLLSFLFIACNEKDDVLGGEGSLQLNVNVENNVTVVGTRALSDSEQNALKESCSIEIYDSSNSLIRSYVGVNSIPNPLTLLVGEYKVVVTAGESAPASFDKKFYKGEQAFTVKKSETTPVSVTCNIANTLVNVAFDTSTLNVVFKDYKVTVSVPDAGLEYTLEDSKTGYYILSEEKQLTCKFEGTTINDTPYTTTYVINNAQEATQYNITYKYKTTATGGGILDVVVDETPIFEDESEVVINRRPAFTLFDAANTEVPLDAAMELDLGGNGGMTMWIITTSPLKSVIMSCNDFTNWGFGKNEYDLSTSTLSDADVLDLQEAGIELNKVISDNGSTWKVSLTEKLMDKITATQGEYVIAFKAVDDNDNETLQLLQINVTPSGTITTDIITADALPGSIWTSKATLRATVVNTATGTVTFNYRKVGDEEWINTPATLSDGIYTADITGLTAATEYEYVVLDGTAASRVVCSFTTETKAQPENAGFENWSGTTPLLMYGDGQNCWWDTGNHGSATMGKNVTVKGTDYKNSGDYSAKLTSQFVGIGIIGKFAAGNAFVGQYLKTDGTDGILGFGRPFASRPKALKGYIRYIPAEVKYAKVPSNVADFPKGGTDIGSIYVAVGDWAGEAYDGTTWPVIVKTKTADIQLFDPTGEGVIAYGVQDWTTSTEGDGLIPFEIPLDYYSLDRKPTALVLVCSASKYGDYFSGGDSTMWIDDFEFIYE